MTAHNNLITIDESSWESQIRNALDHNPGALQDGLTWYQDAHDFALALSRLYRVPLYQVTGIIAAFSIHTKWNENKDRVLDFLDGIVAGLRLQVDKAIDILQCATAQDVARILNGPKIVPFADNILNPTTSREVTVDRHIATFFGVTTKNLTHKYGNDLTVSVRIQNVIRKIADEIGILPLQLQATIWVIVRGDGE